MSNISKEKILAWLKKNEESTAVDLDRYRSTSNYYKECKAANRTYQDVILRIRVGDFDADESELAALKAENGHLEAESNGWFAALQEAESQRDGLREELDRISQFLVKETKNPAQEAISVITELRKENADLQHDLERHMQMSSSLATENEVLRKRVEELEAESKLKKQVAMANARGITRPKTTTNVELYMHLFGCGMTSGTLGCRKIGLDPYSTNSSLSISMKEPTDAN